MQNFRPYNGRNQLSSTSPILPLKPLNNSGYDPVISPQRYAPAPSNQRSDINKEKLSNILKNKPVTKSYSCAQSSQFERGLKKPSEAISKSTPSESRHPVMKSKSMITLPKTSSSTSLPIPSSISQPSSPLSSQHRALLASVSQHSSNSQQFADSPTESNSSQSKSFLKMWSNFKSHVSTNSKKTNKNLSSPGSSETGWSYMN